MAPIRRQLARCAGYLARRHRHPRRPARWQPRCGALLPLAQAALLAPFGCVGARGRPGPGHRPLGQLLQLRGLRAPTDLPWKLFIPLPFRPSEFLDQAYFHPTFLYESIWNLGVCILLLLLFRAASRGRIELLPGTLSCVYLLAYSSGRVWIEGLRTDPLCLLAAPPFCEGGLRMAQLVSLLLIGLGGAGLWWLYGRHRPLPDPSGVSA